MKTATKITNPDTNNTIPKILYVKINLHNLYLPVNFPKQAGYSF